MSHSESERSFGPALRAARERRGLTQADVAARLGVKRETISHWEGGKHLPRPRQSAHLDEVLESDGALRALIDQAREAPAPAAVTTSQETVLSVLRRVQQAVESYLQTDEHGRPLGWCHNLQQVLPPTPLSTAYGIRVLVMLDRTSITRLGGLAERLHSEASAEGGWATRSQTSPSAEATAAVIDALACIDSGTDVASYLDLLELMVDDIVRQRPAILALVLDTMLELRPDSRIVGRLLSDLLALRQPSGRGGRLLWSQKNEPGLASPDPSTYHTARACTVLKTAVLRKGVPAELAGQVDEALATGIAWLLGRRSLEHTSEEVDRVASRRKPETVNFRHFSASWILRALVLCDVPASHPALSAALGRVWDEFDEEHSLWRWPNGDLPIWMSLDGCAALHLAALGSAHR